MQPSAEHQVDPAQLPLDSGFEARAVSPYREMGAYEVLWCDPQATSKSLSKRFAQHLGSVPSDFVPREDAIASAAYTDANTLKAVVASSTKPGALVYTDGETGYVGPSPDMRLSGITRVSMCAA